MEQYDLEHLQSMRTGIINQRQMWWTPELYKLLDTQLENIGKEIARRLQLTLFPEEPEDGAYAD
jgi:hypothetical protein